MHIIEVGRIKLSQKKLLHLGGYGWLECFRSFVLSSLYVKEFKILLKYVTVRNSKFMIDYSFDKRFFTWRGDCLYIYSLQLKK